MPFRRDHDLRLRAFAREMRKTPSDAERRLWWLLRRKKVNGFRFRRQVPILGYIADFCCLEANLIVEVDGSQHALDHQRQYDQERTRVLAENGFKVLRFWAHDVVKFSDAVQLTIFGVLQDPSSLPRYSGGGPESCEG